jgi:hypothetical protein
VRQAPQARYYAPFARRRFHCPASEWGRKRERKRERERERENGGTM